MLSHMCLVCRFVPKIWAGLDRHIDNCTVAQGVKHRRDPRPELYLDEDEMNQLWAHIHIEEDNLTEDMNDLKANNSCTPPTEVEMFQDRQNISNEGKEISSSYTLEAREVFKVNRQQAGTISTKINPSTYNHV